MPLFQNNILDPVCSCRTQLKQTQVWKPSTWLEQQSPIWVQAAEPPAARSPEVLQKSSADGM